MLSGGLQERVSEIQKFEASSPGSLPLDCGLPRIHHEHYGHRRRVPIMHCLCLTSSKPLPSTSSHDCLRIVPLQTALSNSIVLSLFVALLSPGLVLLWSLSDGFVALSLCQELHYLYML